MPVAPCTGECLRSAEVEAPYRLCRVSADLKRGKRARRYLAGHRRRLTETEKAPRRIPPAPDAAQQSRVEQETKKPHRTLPGAKHVPRVDDHAARSPPPPATEADDRAGGGAAPEDDVCPK